MGSPFQTDGKSTEKVRFCPLDVLAKGTRSPLSSVERRQQRPDTLRVGQQSSRRQRQGPASTAIPRQRSCTSFVAGGGASAARPAYSQRGYRIYGCISVFNVLTKDIVIIK